MTDIARDRVTCYGMVWELGYVAYESPRQAFLELLARETPDEAALKSLVVPHAASG